MEGVLTLIHNNGSPELRQTFRVFETLKISTGLVLRRRPRAWYYS